MVANSEGGCKGEREIGGIMMPDVESAKKKINKN